MYTYLTLDEVQMKYANNTGLLNDCVVAVYSNRLGDNMYLDFGTKEAKTRYLKILSLAEPLVSDIVKTANDGFAKGNTFKLSCDNKYARKINDAIKCKRSGDFYGAIDAYKTIYKKDGISEMLCNGLFRVLASYGLVGLAGDLLSIAIEIGRINSAQHEYENDVHLLNRVITSSYDVHAFYSTLNSFSGNINNRILFPLDYMSDQLVPLIAKYAVEENPEESTQQPQYDASQMAQQQSQFRSYGQQ